LAAERCDREQFLHDKQEIL